MDSSTRVLPMDDEPPQADSRLEPGTVLANRYSVEEIIGMGGMGAVYRARDLHFPNVKKWVAIKEMINQDRNPAIHGAMVQTFEREANLLATLSHPAIPRIYDFFTTATKCYLILEYVFGEDLEAILRKSDEFLPENQVIEWAIQLCEVLEVLHSHQPEPIIFRDIKPSNIMINQYNHIILVDFGIAKAIKQGQRGTMMGTEGYSPPEQYRGEASPLVDIYALGATLHHLLTRVNPQFEAPFTFAERPVSTYNQAVSQDLIDIVEHALQYLPEKRFKNAGEMKSALEQLRLRGPLVVQASPVAPTGKPSSEIQPLWVFECEDELRGTPVYAHGAVFIGSCDNNLYAVDGKTGAFIWKSPTGGSIVGKPVIQDDFIYVGSEDHHVYKFSTADGRPVWSYPTAGPVRSSPSLGEGFVFVGSDDGYLHAVNANSGNRLWRFDCGAPVRSSPLYVDNQVYVGCENGDFFSLTAFGELKWHQKTKRPVTSSPFWNNGMLFFASMDANFYAFDAKMGWVVWRTRMAKGSISSPYCLGGLVYTGCIDGSIYAFDQSSGREIWSFKTGHQVTGSPICANGNVYCGSVDGSMYSLDAKTGILRWKYPTNAPITGAPALNEDILYFGSTDHRVYALLA